MRYLLLAILMFRPAVGEPKPAPEPQYVVVRWDHSYDGRWVITLAREDKIEETRPWFHSWDAFAGVSEGPDFNWQPHVRKTHTEIFQAAWNRAQEYPDVACCWPGEQAD